MIFLYHLSKSTLSDVNMSEFSVDSNNFWFHQTNYLQIKKYQASTTILITHLSDIFWLVSLRAVEWAHIRPKLIIIKCDESRRLENLVSATLATKFRRKTRRKIWLFSTTLSIFKRFSICLRNNHRINVIFLHIYFLSNHRDVVVAIHRICICLSVCDNFWSSSK
jgi:hypothetical protein